MRTWKRLALLLAVPLVVAGCGHGVQLNTSAESAYLDLLATLEGTAQQRNSAAFIKYDTLQSGYTHCMDSLGFKYPQRPFHPPVPFAEVSNRMGTEWLEPPANDLDIAKFMVGNRFAERDWKDSPYLDLNEDQQAQYNTALNECGKNEDAWSVQGTPDVFLRVRSALGMTIEDIEKGLDTSSYGPCMKDQGFDVASYSDLYQQVWGKFPPVYQSPATIDGGDAAWQRDIALEHDAATADATCRADIYAQGVNELDQRLPEFETQLSTEIADLPQAWAAVVSEANRRSPGGICEVCQPTE